MPPRTTLKQVAEHAKVSVMTASRALREGRYVREEVRERVLASAEALGYRKDPMLTALSEYRRRERVVKDYRKIGLINAWPAGNDWLELAPGRAALEGIHRRAHELGFNVEVFRIDEMRGDVAALLRALRNRGIEALILLPLPIPPPIDFSQRLEEWERFVIVSVAHGFAYPHCHYVWTDQFASACMLWEALRERGYRRIALELSDESAVRSHGLWEAAYLMKQNSIGEPALPILRTKVSQRRRFKQWFKETSPDAVMGKQIRRKAKGVSAIFFAFLGLRDPGLPRRSWIWRGSHEWSPKGHRIM